LKLCWKINSFFKEDEEILAKYALEPSGISRKKIVAVQYRREEKKLILDILNELKSQSNKLIGGMENEDIDINKFEASY
jgi:hypothetical protein